VAAGCGEKGADGDCEEMTHEVKGIRVVGRSWVERGAAGSWILLWQEASWVLANRRSFDCVSRDKTARDFAQDDTS
jgi:hypothetical protein